MNIILLLKPIAVIKDEVSAIYSPPSTATTKTTVTTAQQATSIKATPLETEKMKNDLLSLQDTIQKLKQQINVYLLVIY